MDCISVNFADPGATLEGVPFVIGDIIIALASATVTLTPSPVKCSKVAVGGQEPCISERAKRVSGLL